MLGTLGINLFLVPFGRTDGNGDWNWKAGTRKLKISKARNGKITLKFYRVISPSQFTQERRFGRSPTTARRTVLSATCLLGLDFYNLIVMHKHKLLPTPAMTKFRYDLGLRTDSVVCRGEGNDHLSERYRISIHLQQNQYHAFVVQWFSRPNFGIVRHKWKVPNSNECSSFGGKQKAFSYKFYP